MALNITLNGSNYVSEKTRVAFEQALQETESRRQEIRTENRESRIENRESGIEPPATHTPQPITYLFETLDRALSQAYEHQTLTVRVHEQYLSNQGEYARLFGQLLQQQATIFAQAAAIPQQAEMTATVLETLARSMARFHDLQEQTLDVHRQFLAQQSAYAQATMQLLAGQANGEWQPAIVESPKSRVENQPVYADETVKRGNGNGRHPQDAGSTRQETGGTRQEARSTMQASVDRPILQSSNPSISQSLIPSLLAIVSEKTGYPVEMLDLDMDMEADLGIDSIKRVEILGALQDAHPDLPEVSTDVLAEMRTLRQIVEKMQEAGGKGQESRIKNHESANQQVSKSADSDPIIHNPQPTTLKKA